MSFSSPVLRSQTHQRACYKWGSRSARISCTLQSTSILQRRTSRSRSIFSDRDSSLSVQQSRENGSARRLVVAAGELPLISSIPIHKNSDYQCCVLTTLCLLHTCSIHSRQGVQCVPAKHHFEAQQLVGCWSLLAPRREPGSLCRGLCLQSSMGQQPVPVASRSSLVAVSDSSLLPCFLGSPQLQPIHALYLWEDC